jgi:hypothetical protein
VLQQLQSEPEGVEALFYFEAEDAFEGEVVVEFVPVAPFVSEPGGQLKQALEGRLLDSLEVFFAEGAILQGDLPVLAQEEGHELGFDDHPFGEEVGEGVGVGVVDEMQKEHFEVGAFPVGEEGVSVEGLDLRPVLEQLRVEFDCLVLLEVLDLSELLLVLGALLLGVEQDVDDGLYVLELSLEADEDQSCLGAEGQLRKGLQADVEQLVVLCSEGHSPFSVQMVVGQQNGAQIFFLGSVRHKHPFLYCALLGKRQIVFVNVLFKCFKREKQDLLQSVESKCFELKKCQFFIREGVEAVEVVYDVSGLHFQQFGRFFQLLGDYFEDGEEFFVVMDGRTSAMLGDGWEVHEGVG